MLQFLALMNWIDSLIIMLVLN